MYYVSGEINLATCKEVRNGNDRNTSNNEVLLPKNGQMRPENVDRTISDENNSN